MGQKISKEYSLLTLGYIDRSNSKSNVVDLQDSILSNMNLPLLQTLFNQLQYNDESTLLNSLYEYNLYWSDETLLPFKSSLAQDLEYVDRNYYPEFGKFDKTNKASPKQFIYQQSWSALTIADATRINTVEKLKRWITYSNNYINLSNKHIVKLNSTIGYLGHLTKLNMSNNKIKTLPKEIGYLKNLCVLDASNNQIKELPNTIGLLSNLKILDLSRNNIKQLPKYICQLFRLKILFVQNNQLTSVPHQISNLYNLRTLHVSNNPLDSLPAELSELNSLVELRTDNCLFKEEYIYSLKHDPPSLFETCARLAVRHHISIPERKFDHIQHYFSKLDFCSYCKGPFFDSYLTRIKFKNLKSTQPIPLKDRLCCSHWSDENDHLLFTFSQPSPIPSSKNVNKLDKPSTDFFFNELSSLNHELMSLNNDPNQIDSLPEMPGTSFKPIDLPFNPKNPTPQASSSTSFNNPFSTLNMSHFIDINQKQKDTFV